MRWQASATTGAVGLAWSLAAVCASAQTTYLVKDINQNSPEPSSSTPAPGVSLGGRLLLSADDGIHGRELWKSDGTEGGTVLVADIWPGPNGSFPGYGFPPRMVVSGGVAFFTADDGIHGRELWRSDGTTPGTQMVVDINPGPASAIAAEIAVFNGALFFSADDGIHGPELWKSDGTVEGTALVKDIEPYGLGGPGPYEFTVSGGQLFFKGDDGVHGRELWKTDGTADGTVLVADITPGYQQGMPPGFLTDWNGLLIFKGDDLEHGEELWRSDGTAAGTALVKDILPGSESGLPAGFIPAGPMVVFSATGPEGAEPWRTDGTEAGTTMIRDIIPGPDFSGATPLLNIGATVFLEASGGLETGVELWKTDGTEGGTVLVKDVNPGGAGSYPNFAVNGGGLLFFVADQAAIGQELWMSDGSEAGTSLVADLRPGPESSLPFGFLTVGGRIFFAANDGATGFELWAAELPPPAMTIADVAVSEGHNHTGVIATFAVSLSHAAAHTVMAQYATAPGTAEPPKDYVSATGLVSFAPGSTTSVVEVLVNGDRKCEDDEIFVVNLSQPVSGTIGDGQGVGTILNDDCGPH